MSGAVEPASIAAAGTGDLEELLPLISAYRAFYRQQPDPQRERELIEAHLRKGTSAIFVARIAGEVVGFVQLFQTSSTVWLGPSLVLEDLFVTPSARGQGVATMLLDRAMAYALEVGAVGMFLETAIDNLTAQAVYERAGWAREGRFYKYNAPL